MSLENLFAGYPLVLLYASPILVLSVAALALLGRGRDRHPAAARLGLLAFGIILLKTLAYPLTRNLLLVRFQAWPGTHPAASVSRMLLLWKGHDILWILVSTTAYLLLLLAILRAMGSGGAGPSRPDPEASTSAAP